MTVLQRPAAPAPVEIHARPRVRGKFLYVGNEKLYLRGVTYGTFRPTEDGETYRPAVVERDFAQMAANGINAVRTYTVPPRWLLDAAQRHGLRVMVGLPWEQHVAFLDDGRLARSIEQRVRDGVRACAGHPAVLCYVIGNEIAAPIVRWHGRRRIERYLERLCRAAKAEDPDALVTYVNYPTTEFLQLPFVDVVAFNAYIESQERFEAYLARLQNIAGDRPLVMAEIGLDSRRHGEAGQARALDWQVRTAFAAGCAGAFVFSWTDEWYRGYDIEDWDFGITSRDRCPKPALDAVRAAFAEAPFPPALPWPRVSVVVCSYNGSRTIRDCLAGLQALDYPDYEVIVVDDGSTDATAAIAAEYGVRVIGTENRGLSSARNTGLEAATGKIVAYIDDDAYPDAHWLTYLAATFLCSTHVGVGGPNIPPAGDGPIADCVANAPGGPIHVLLSDREAEHIPGCNMAFQRAALQEIGGFDPRFRAAGDDVDFCWRLRKRGWTLGFSPGAVVWHHRRNSVRAYWKQQVGYGKAEALLERKWPEQYNGLGHVTWAGRLYGRGLSQALARRQGRIYQGTWGGAPFQALYDRPLGVLSSLPMMPEWYLAIAALGALSALALQWTPFVLALPLLALVAGAPLVQAGLSAARASFPNAPRSGFTELRLRSLTAFLHLLQPLARLSGRMRYGLTLWRGRARRRFELPRSRTSVAWSEEWRPASERLTLIEKALRASGTVVLRGGDFDRWDLQARAGLLATARLRMAIEEHGAGKQVIRIRIWPRWSVGGPALVALSATLAAAAAYDAAWAACSLLAGLASLVALRMAQEASGVMAALLEALAESARRQAP